LVSAKDSISERVVKQQHIKEAGYEISKFETAQLMPRKEAISLSGLDLRL
jgi:hypothetical protein